MTRLLGRRTIARPGGLSKLLVWSLLTASRPLRVRILQAAMDGMPEHQEQACITSALTAPTP